jgi:hypothetical protein
MRNLLSLPPAIRAALALLTDSVPRTPGMSYADVYSEALGQWVLAGYECDEDGTALYEVWLRGARVDDGLSVAKLDLIEAELAESLREDAAEFIADLAIASHQDRALTHYTAQAALIPMMGLRA